jgi:hypothetical protein
VQIKVRRALSFDVEWMLEELKSFSDFFGTKIPLFGDANKASDILHSLVKNHYFLVAECPIRGELGFIAGLLNPHILNPDIIVLSELFWWVKEEHRGSMAGSLLLKDFIEFGKNNADWIICTLEKDSPVNEEAFIRRGFHFQEKSFLLEVA